MLVLTTAGARALDQAAQQRFGIPGIVLMENAAIGMAAIARDMLLATRGMRATVLCGPGNNGGDGYAIARHLANAGCGVVIVTVGEPRRDSDAATNASIAAHMEVTMTSAISSLASANLVIDALFGSGLDRPLSGNALDAIRAMNSCGAPILAVDLPSGLDGDSGLPLGDAVRATVTAVTVAPRPACFIDAARPFIGRWQVVDIGAPAALLKEFGTERESA